MYARVVRVTGDPAKVDDGIETYRSRVGPVLREQDGYAGARLLIDRETGTGMSISYWQDEQALRASDSAISSVRDETISRFGASTPPSENYEAAIQHRLQPTELGNWVRVTSLQGDPGKVDDSIRHFESQVIPAISQPPLCSTSLNDLGATGSPVPYQCLRRAHATYTPGTARTTCRPLPGSRHARKERTFLPGLKCRPGFDAICTFRCVSSGSHTFVFSSLT
jgi:Antibiotic biosynthesis monooxygenase